MRRQRELVRSFAATLDSDSDAREIYGPLVPWDTVAWVSDPGAPPYREAFARGAFAGQVPHPASMTLQVEHQTDVMSTLGKVRSLEDRPDALWLQAQVVTGPVGDQALELVRGGVFSLSVRFRVSAGGTRVDADGVRWRTRAHAIEASLVRSPAYPGTHALARRAHGTDLSLWVY